MAGSGGRLPLDLLATVAGWALTLARGLLFLCSERCAWLLGAPCLRRAYHAWLAGAVVLGPLLHPLADPHAILANQRNFFSRTFVASAWGWTCILAGGFALLVSYGATGRALAPLRPLARLAVGTGLQLAAAAAFGLVEELTGYCYAPLPAGTLLPPLPDRPGCLAAGHRWRGSLPSRPTFLLTFCCLLLAEELAVFRRYLARGHPAGAPLRLVFLLNVLLLGLWNLLLLGTAVYGPAYGPQLVGAAAGTLAWYLTYQGWYPRPLVPGPPGRRPLPQGRAARLRDPGVRDGLPRRLGGCMAGGSSEGSWPAGGTQASGSSTARGGRSPPPGRGMHGGKEQRGELACWRDPGILARGGREQPEEGSGGDPSPHPRKGLLPSPEGKGGWGGVIIGGGTGVRELEGVGVGGEPRCPRRNGGPPTPPFGGRKTGGVNSGMGPLASGGGGGIPSMERMTTGDPGVRGTNKTWPPALSGEKLSWHCALLGGGPRQGAGDTPHGSDGGRGPWHPGD